MSEATKTKTQFVVTGTRSTGEPFNETVAASSEQGVRSWAAKNGIEVASVAPAAMAYRQPRAMGTDDLFPPVTIERVTFGAAAMIGVGVFAGTLFAVVAAAVVLKWVGILAGAE